VRWYQNGLPILAGGSSSSYAIPSLSAAHEGTYEAWVTAGEQLVKVPAGQMSVLSLLSQPVSMAVLPGGSFSFSVETQSSTPLTYQWYQGGVLLPGQTKDSLKVLTGATFTVKITNAFGCKDSSSGVVVTQYALPTVSISPTITTYKCAGDSLLYTASGTGLTSYQWYYNGAAITSNGNGTTSSRQFQIGAYCPVSSEVMASVSQIMRH
jgi:hypothetical protein